MKIMA